MTTAFLAGENFAKMSREDLIGFCRKLYQERGVAALRYSALNSVPKLYQHLYRRKLSQKTLLKELGVENEYRQHALGQPYRYGATERTRWSWAMLVEKAQLIKESHGRLPPALWCQKNGNAAFILDSSVAIPFRRPTKVDGSREAADVSALRR